MVPMTNFAFGQFKSLRSALMKVVIFFFSFTARQTRSLPLYR
jgi:hypothetical protein